MPEFLERKLRKEYGDNPHAIYGTMNKIGAMKGNKETKKGEKMEKKHMRDIKPPAKSKAIQNKLGKMEYKEGREGKHWKK